MENIRQKKKPCKEMKILPFLHFKHPISDLPLVYRKFGTFKHIIPHLFDFYKL